MNLLFRNRVPNISTKTLTYILSICSILFLVSFQIKNALKLDYAYASHDFVDTIDETTTAPYDVKKSGQHNNNFEFSACLMVKDEDHNLPEWVAYHYYMANLRHLVVCLDPGSKTNPKTVLQRWGTRMRIEIWHNSSFFTPTSKLFLKDYETEHLRTLRIHRARQRDCYKKCMQHLYDSGKSWTMLIDVDEFLTFNPVAEDDTKLLYSKDDESDPNSLYKFNPSPIIQRDSVLQHKGIERRKKKKRNDGKTAKARQRRNDVSGRKLQGRINASLPEIPEKLQLTETEKKMMEMRVRVPRNAAQKTITDFMQDEQLNAPFSNSSCIVLPRLQFGSTEETHNTHSSRAIPPSQIMQDIAKNLTTLRFFNHAKKGSYANRAGKCIVDVSRIKSFFVMNPHRINIECGREAFPEHYTASLRVNHYSSTKELYFAQGGVRRDEENFERKSNVKNGVCYEMRGWLQAFVKEIGSEKKAMTLLKGAGEISN